jgi:thioredoxin 1
MKKVFSLLHIVRNCFLTVFIGALSTTVFGQNATVLPAADFNKKLLETPAKQIIDVRTPKEFATGHLPNAVNINFNDSAFASNIASLDKSKPVFVYCLAGGRSANAAKKMEEAGFTTVYDLKGGVMAWQNNNMPYVIGTQPEAKDIFTRKDFYKLLAANPKLLIDFYAPWCGPCLKMEPFTKKLKEKYAGKVTVVRINIDEAKTLAKQLKIEALPVVAIYKDGHEVKRSDGFQSGEALEGLIKLVL